ncbi:MAG: hypothetical protein ACJA07_001511 [Rhodococcus sp. (in: high G+C Gram-positive bacteria)]|jgi:hypothetical protein
MVGHSELNRDGEDETDVAALVPDPVEAHDPVSNALGFWNWMFDNGYEPSAEERPTG